MDSSNNDNTDSINIQSSPNKSFGSHLLSEGYPIRPYHTHIDASIFTSDYSSSNFKFFGTVTSYVIGFLWIWFVFQFYLYPTVFDVSVMSSEWFEIFATSSGNLFTLGSIFQMVSHGNFTHLLINSIVFGSFGWYVEERTTIPYYLLFLFTAGLLSGSFQSIAGIIFSHPTPSLGASGFIAAVFGYVSVIKSDLRVLLFFIIPVQLKYAIGFFIGGSLAIVLFGGVGAFGFAHIAHLTGALYGIIIAIVSETNILSSCLSDSK